MKRALKWAVAGLIAAVSLAATGTTHAQIYGNGALTTTDPTYHPTNASSSGTGREYYDLYQIAVSVSGTFTLEVSSLNTVGTPSNALDTLFSIYTGTFNAATPGTATFTNDDFSGTLTVLPGPFVANGYTATATGSSGAQPSSRSATIALTAGTTYFLAISSFQNTSYVATTTSAGATGAYVYGLASTTGGLATVAAVPEPATTAWLLAAVGGLGFTVLRRRRTA